MKRMSIVPRQIGSFSTSWRTSTSQSPSCSASFTFVISDRCVFPKTYLTHHRLMTSVIVHRSFQSVNAFGPFSLQKHTIIPFMQAANPFIFTGMNCYDYISGCKFQSFPYMVLHVFWKPRMLRMTRFRLSHPAWPSGTKDPASPRHCPPADPQVSTRPLCRNRT